MIYLKFIDLNEFKQHSDNNVKLKKKEIDK